MSRTNPWVFELYVVILSAALLLLNLNIAGSLVEHGAMPESWLDELLVPMYFIGVVIGVGSMWVAVRFIVDLVDDLIGGIRPLYVVAFAVVVWAVCFVATEPSTAALSATARDQLTTIRAAMAVVPAVEMLGIMRTDWIEERAERARGVFG